MNTIPWVREMEKRYGERGLVIIGVHTPEFDQRSSRANVEAAVKEHGLGAHSHFLDNHMDYWRALRNEYWPAIYVVDGRGQIRTRSSVKSTSARARTRTLAAWSKSSSRKRRPKT